MEAAPRTLADYYFDRLGALGTQRFLEALLALVLHWTDSQVARQTLDSTIPAALHLVGWALQCKNIFVSCTDTQ